MRRASTIAWTIGLLAISGGAFYAWRTWDKEREAQRVKFETTPIDRGAIIAKVTASGTLSALVTVQVGSQVSGRIKELHATFNTAVTKGQLIARIDPQLFRAALEQAHANFLAAQGDLLAAKVQAVNADKQLVRAKGLADRKLTAEADFDTAQATADVARAQVASAEGHLAQTKAALHQAEVNLDYTSIISPIDGVVISRSVDEGQTVAASMQAPILFTIAEDLRKMQVDTSVAEADVGKLKDGMVATFSVDAYPTERFEGRVRQIRNAAQTLQNVVTYDAVIDVANPKLELRPGMTANVTFVHANRSNVLRVVNAALRFRPAPELLEKGVHKSPDHSGAAQAQSQPRTPRMRAKSDEPPDRRTVWVLRNNQPVPVKVKIGVTDGTHTEILEGSLNEGDAAITDVAATGTTAKSPPPGGAAQQRFGRIL
jgi:HlyD family secretion protein